MPQLIDIIESIFPSDQVTGTVLTDTVRITFDRAMDENSLEHSIILEGPDSDRVIHNPYLETELKSGSEKRLLESPGYLGIVPGTFSFERLNPGTNLVVQTEDTAGVGNLYKTRAIFRPSKPLAPDFKYRIHIVGDEAPEDDEDFGLRARSVFDVLPDPGNTTTGIVICHGTYRGTSSSNVLNIRIIDSGLVGTATFEWWLSSNISNLLGPARTHINNLHLITGIGIRFTEGSYVAGDEFSIQLRRSGVFEGTVFSEFTTGGGSILPAPDSTATSPTGTPLPSNPLPTMRVVKTSPAHMAVNQKAKDYDRIIIEFNEAIDPSSFDVNDIRVTAEPVIDHPNLKVNSPNGEVAKIVTVDGNKLIIDV